MPRRSQYDLSDEMVKYVKEDIGDRILPMFTVEELLDRVPTEDRLIGLSAEDREKLLKQLQKDLAGNNTIEETK